MLKGLDISNWNSIGTGDWADDFVICKATEGVGFVDPLCDQHYQRAKSQGKLLGVYHFARPDMNSAEAEADFFVNNIQGYIGEAILVLDWEVATSNVAWADTFLRRVEALTGVKPLIYMSASVVSANDWTSVVNGNYGLWIAGYPSAYNVLDPPTPSVEDMPYSFGSWPFWAIWQYSSSAGTLDRNIANMTREAWQTYAAKNGETPELPPTPNPAPAPQNYQIYTVVPGDNLSVIAARFGTTWQKIAANNAIATPNTIYAGTVLRIYPGANPTPSGGITVGSNVVLNNWVDYNGIPLTQYRDYYTVSEINGDRAVLTADGAVYAAVNINNLRRV